MRLVFHDGVHFTQSYAAPYLKTKPITQNPAVPLPHQTLSVFNVIKSPTAVNDRKEKKSLGKYVGHSMSQNPIQTSAALLKPDVYLTGQF